MIIKIPNIYNYLTESIDVQGFNIEEFKKLTTFQKRIQYCAERLQRINQGSSRIVYKLPDEKVLKLAKSKKGIAQNEAEIEQSLDNYINSLLAKVYDYDENNLWLVAQYCKPINDQRFQQLVGVKFSDYWDIITYEDYERNPVKYRRAVTKPSKPKIQDYYENEFINDMMDYIINYEPPIGDILRISSYGETSDGSLVLIDYGLTKSVGEEFYNHKKY